MREKVNQEVRNVTADWNAGRIRWNQRTVRALILPYPRHSKYDDVFDKLQEHAGLDEGDVPWEEDEAAEDDCKESSDDRSDVDEEDEDVRRQGGGEDDHLKRRKRSIKYKL